MRERTRRHVRNDPLTINSAFLFYSSYLIINTIINITKHSRNEKQMVFLFTLMQIEHIHDPPLTYIHAYMSAS